MPSRRRPLPEGNPQLHDLNPIPAADSLTTLERDAQAALAELVERAGGRVSGTRSIPIGHISVLATLLDDYGRRNAEVTREGLIFRGRPGLWHALDSLYPLLRTSRWIPLRGAAIIELERRGWRRLSPPRGSAFFLLD